MQGKRKTSDAVTVGVKPSRRTRVKNHPGVYYRDTPRGRKYEISWMDAEGRRRWRTIDGFHNLAAADAAVAEERRKTRRGERTAPAKAPTVSEFADEWLAAKRIRERTREKYEVNLRLHVKGRSIGRLKVSDVRVDDVAKLVRELESDGKATATVQGVLVALSGMLGYAVRRGFLPANPVHQLSRDERPRSTERREFRVLDTDELRRLLAAAPKAYRPLLVTAALSGLRLAELLGLQWHDVDFDAGLIRVRRQWDRSLAYSEPKTSAGKRNVVMQSALAKVLKEHRLASPFSADEDPVFAATSGQPFGWRNVERRGMDKAVENAKLDKVAGKRRPTLHDLRHTFASTLIADGNDVAFVSRQLGHSKPSMTLDVYTHLFDAVDRMDSARAALDARHGTLLERTGDDRRRTAESSDDTKPAKVLRLATGGD